VLDGAGVPGDNLVLMQNVDYVRLAGFELSSEPGTFVRAFAIGQPGGKIRLDVEVAGRSRDGLEKTFLLDDEGHEVVDLGARRGGGRTLVAISVKKAK